jgi:membrane protease YdiL (CAAX protease family)
MREQLDQLEGFVVVIVVGALLLLAEFFLWQQFVISGLLLHSVVLVLLLLFGTFRWPNPQYQLVVLTIPALVRLLAYTLPLGELSPLFAQVVIGVPLVLTAVSLSWVLEQPPPPIQATWRHLPYYLLLLLAGAAGGLLLYQIQQPAPLVWDSPWLLLFYLLVLLVAMAGLEEWLFRGIMQTALNQIWGNWLWVSLIVAIFYTSLSLGQGSALWLVVVLVIAFALSGLRHRRDNLLDVWLVHSGLNVTFFLILPYWGLG